MVTHILDTIESETASEKIQREVSLLNDIHQCSRTKKETPEAYANRFDAKVARYVPQRSDRNSYNDPQWALLLIQNANSSADTRHSLTFQLTTGAAMRKDTPSTAKVDLPLTTARSLIASYAIMENVTDETQIIAARFEIKKSM